MLLTPNAALPYPDPAGQDMASPVPIQAMAERIDSTLDNYDVLVPRITRRQTTILRYSVNGTAQPSGGPYATEFDTIVDSNGIDGLVGVFMASGSSIGFSPVSASYLAPLPAWVRVGIFLSISPTGAITAATKREVRIQKIADQGLGIGLATQTWQMREYETNTGGTEYLNLSVVMHLSASERLVKFDWSHGNTGSTARVNANSYCYATYLCPAGG